MILERTTRTADVYPYDESYAPMTNVPIVSGATAWDDEDGTTYILVFNESLYYGSKLHHSLINPNQVRMNGVDFWDNPFDPYHRLSIEVEGGPFIPMHYVGTKLQFTTRVPTDAELNDCHHIDMTSKQPWEPQQVVLAQLQSSTTSDDQPLRATISTIHTNDHPFSTYEEVRYSYLHPSSTDAILHSIQPSLVMLSEIMSDVNSEANNNNIIGDDYVIPSDVPARRTFISHERHRSTTAMNLAEAWGIGIKRAKDTMMATTQRGTRSAILPLSRRYRADMRYNVKTIEGKYATDTLWSEVRSLHQNVCAQVYTNKNGFTVCYPMAKATGDTIGDTLSDFIHDFGVPEHLTFDGAQAQVGKGTEFMKKIKKYSIKYHISSPRRPNENPAEASIRELKKRWYRIMVKKNVPKRLWDYGLVWVSETGNLSVSSSRYAKGRTPLEIVTGETPDISEYLDFSFYDWVTFNINAGLGETQLGRWLGVSHKIGQLMSYWILTPAGHVVSCVTVQRLTNLEQQTDKWKNEMQKYDVAIEKRFDTSSSKADKYYGEAPVWNRLTTSDVDEEFIDEFNKVISDSNVKEVDEEPTPDAFDPYVSMEIGLPRGADDELQHAHVKKRVVDDDGKPVGVANNNPLLDSRMYEVEFLDGSTETLAANIIAENLLAQVDEHGHRQMLLDEIIDHRTTSEAVPKSEGYITTKNGTKRKVRTTKGWQLCIQWRDGSTNWIPLKDVKESNPVELAQYAIEKGIANEPAFAWWIDYTMKKKKAIISKVRSKYWQRTHKYGIRMPKSVEEAYQIDLEEGNTLWRDAIAKEMNKIRDAFELYTGDPSTLIGYQEITTHWIFDIKLGENFRRKARLVGDGHKTKPPTSVTYSSVVSRESVRVCLLIAALNELQVLSGDIENAYLTAPCRERCWTRGGAEFGTGAGNIFIIARALYGLKSSGAAFRSFLAETLDAIEFKSSIADPDVWMRPATKPDNEQYYEYVLCYVDDILCISYDARKPMDEIARCFKFKNDEIVPPEIYLGARLEEKSINNHNCWTMSSKDYVKASVANLEERLGKLGMKPLPTKANLPMTSNYVPELDGTPELDEKGVTMFQELIGILRWAIEIGRVDIMTEVSMLSSYQASPREGHLEQAIHIFAYLKKNPKLTLYFDPALPRIDESGFIGGEKENFLDYYRDAAEEMPPRMPEPKGRQVTTTAFVDASHAANKVTRRSHTGFVLFVNRAPVLWYSKRQNTIESSTFSSEFVAMKTCMEAIVALRYKLRMFGVPTNTPTDVLCDNQSVVNNSSKVDSVLNKKHSSIAYHAVRWTVAAGAIRVGKIGTDENIADAFTKRLSIDKRKYLFGAWTY